MPAPPSSRRMTAAYVVVLVLLAILAVAAHQILQDALQVQARSLAGPAPGDEKAARAALVRASRLEQGILAGEIVLFLAAGLLIFRPMARRIERELAAQRRVEATRRAILETALDAIVSIDAEGRIVEFNPAAERLFGHTRSAAMGRSLADLIVPEAWREEHRRGLARYLATGESRVLGKRMEVTAQCADGSEFPAEVAIARVPQDGTPLFTGIVRDISERKKTIRALAERAAEMARANAELDQFASIVSHDLQAPLRVMAGYLQILEKRHKDRLAPDAQDLISEAVGAARGMSALIGDLLTFSKSGKLNETFRPVSCDEILAAALANLRTSILETGAKVQAPPLPTVTGIRLQLIQVFQNLLDNAIKYRGPSPPRIAVVAERREDEWIFFFKDNGIGFEARHAERIFRIFQRLHEPGKHPGTGVGLAIVKKIVEAHGGRVWVKSEPGKGSTFCFSLPVSRAETGAAELRAGTGPS